MQALYFSVGVAHTSTNLSDHRKHFTSSLVTAIVCLNYLPILAAIGIVDFLTLQQSEGDSTLGLFLTEFL